VELKLHVDGGGAVFSQKLKWSVESVADGSQRSAEDHRERAKAERRSSHGGGAGTEQRGLGGLAAWLTFERPDAGAGPRDLLVPRKRRQIPDVAVAVHALTPPAIHAACCPGAKWGVGEPEQHERGPDHVGRRLGAGDAENTGERVL
jgi:hypothetical protein